MMDVSIRMSAEGCLANQTSFHPIYRGGKAVTISHGPKDMARLIAQISECNNVLLLALHDPNGRLVYKNIKVTTKEQMSLAEIKVACEKMPRWGIAVNKTGDIAFIGQVNGLMGGDFTLALGKGFMFEAMGRSNTNYRIRNSKGEEILYIELGNVARDPGRLNPEDISVQIQGENDLNIAYHFGRDKDLMHAIAIRGGRIRAHTCQEYWMHASEHATTIAWTAQNTVAFTHAGRTEYLNFDGDKWYLRK